LSTPCSLCPENSGHDLSGVSDVFQCNCAAGMYKSPNFTSVGTSSFVCTTCEQGFSCSASSSSVVMSFTLGLSISVQEFSPALQLDLREAVAVSVAEATSVDIDLSRVVIVSISEQSYSRRLLSFSFRRLLSSSIAVQFDIILDGSTNVSLLGNFTVEQVNEQIMSSELPSIEMLVTPSFVTYDQKQLCPSDSFCAGGEEIFFCRLFSRAQLGASSQEQCMCEPGYYSLNATASCNKCSPGHYCPGGLQLIQCPTNATSAAGAHSEEKCFCQHGTWRGCSRMRSGSFLNNTGHPCVIDWKSPCALCGANDICFNDTLLHCPKHSTSPPGSSQPSHCVCNGGFEEVV